MQGIQGKWPRETCRIPCDSNVCKGINKVNEFLNKILISTEKRAHGKALFDQDLYKKVSAIKSYVCFLGM
ncbi:hypothetical protein FORC087_2520 [Bacillus cereus]|nr:hypothetical protein FORC087_2520 [Bacillus cereus]